MFSRKALLAGISSLGLVFCHVSPSLAEDCTGVLPAGNCTLDENTTAALTIDAGILLTVGGSVTIGHTIDGDDNAGDGAITTNSGGVAVNQTAAIGATTAIDSLTIGNTDSWTTSANIITNNNGTDIDLGAADGGEILTFNNGADFIGEIDGNATDVVNFGADGNGGTFTAGGQMESVTVNIISGTLLVNSTFGSGTPLNDVTVSQGATIRLNQGITSGGAFNNDGTVFITADETLSVNTYTGDATSGTFIFELDRDAGVTEFGSFAVTAGGPVDLSNDVINISIAQGSEVLTSETIASVITGNGGATLLPTLQENSFLYDFSLVQNGNDVNLVVTRQDLTAASTSSNNAKAANLLMSTLGTTGDETIQQIQSNLSNAATQEQFNEIVESTLPTVDAGVAATSAFVTNKTITLAQQRLAYLRNGNGASGIASGNGVTSEERDAGRVWGQVFVTSGEQGNRDQVDGYDLDTLGTSIGADTGRLHDNLVMGMALTYAETDIKSNNANATDTDINSYQLALYGTYEVERDTFWNGTVAYGYNNVSSARSNVGLTGLTASAKYDSEQLTLYTEFGHDFELGNKTIITPVLLTHYSYLETENYRERGASGANLTVNTHSLQAWDLGGRIDFAWEKIYDSGQYLRPAVSLGYQYDVFGDPIEAIAILEAGGPAFQINGFETQNHTISLAGGLTYGGDSWELQAHYEMQNRGDLLLQTAILRGTYKF